MVVSSPVLQATTISSSSGLLSPASSSHHLMSKNQPAYPSHPIRITTSSKGDYKIYICNTTPGILARLRPVLQKQHGLSKVRVHWHPQVFWVLMFSRRLVQPLSVCLKYVTYFLYCANSHESLQSDATRRRRRHPVTSPAISFPHRLQKPLPATEL
jgi:hypothetical protein